MPGRRSLSVEPENIAVASPRRSSRIKVNHQDSPLPANKPAEQELPAKRTRRSLSIQEKSLSDIKSDVKKIQDDEKPKTPARRTRRSISAQEEQKPTLKEIDIKLIKSEIKEDVEDNENEKQQKSEEEKTPPPKDLEKPAGRPKGRVTRSMSKSPVSLKNAKPTTTTAAPVTRSRRVSLNDKQSSESKVLTLDIIKENESEHEKNEETTENDFLNNNKKQAEISEKETASTSEDIKTESTVETADKNEIKDIPGDTEKETPNIEKETLDVEIETPDVEKETPNEEKETLDVEKETPDVEKETLDVGKETLDVEKENPDVEKDTPDAENMNKSVKEILNTSVKISPRRSPRVKTKESTPIIKQKDDEDKIENNETNPEIIEEEEPKSNEEKIEKMEKKLSELIEDSSENNKKRRIDPERSR